MTDILTLDEVSRLMTPASPGTADLFILHIARLVISDYDNKIKH